MSARLRHAAARPPWRAIVLGLILAGVLWNRPAQPLHARQQDDPPPPPPPPRVGQLMYAGGKTASCFSEGFLTAVDQEDDYRVHRKLVPVQAASEDLPGYVAVVMSGEGAFELGEDDVKNLRAYLSHGGFILASAGCSDARWAQAFRREIQRLLPDATLEAMKIDHPALQTIKKVDKVLTSKPTDTEPFHAVTLEGRLAVVFSPLGLNDTSNAGPGCCCCGANEIRNARDLNANILAHVLKPRP